MKPRGTDGTPASRRQSSNEGSFRRYLSSSLHGGLLPAHIGSRFPKTTSPLPIDNHILCSCKPSYPSSCDLPTSSILFFIHLRYLDFLSVALPPGQCQAIGQTTDSLQLGMTDPENPDVYFRTVVHLGECGLASADELVRQAAQRLDKVSLTPEISLSLGKGRTAGEMAEKSYAFPQTTPDRSSSKNVESPANEPVDNAQPSSSRQTDISRLRHHRPTSSRSSINPKCHGRKTSTTSLSSFSLISTTPGMARPKSTISLASLTTTYENEVCLENEGDARGCLRGVLAAASIPTSASASAPGGGDDVEGGSGDDGNVWPSLARWTIGTGPTNISPPSTHGSTSTLVENETFPRREVIHPDKPVIQIIKPTIGRSTPAPHLRTTSSSSSPDLPSFFKSKSRLQFKKHTNHLSTSTLPLPRPSSSTLLQAHHQTQINPIDPKLAAAELSSALTKHVSCSMCGLEGVNFPECRKCGMRFCSRGCRIGVGKGGDGRRHVCKGLREGEAEVSLRGEGEMERAELRGKEVGVVC